MTTTTSPVEIVEPDALRVAVFGLGREGLAQAAVLAMRADAALVGLGDTHAPAVRRARGIGFAAPGFTRLDRLIAEASPQALVLAVPPRERAAAARAALEAGVPVLVEPPIAATLEESEALVALAVERGIAVAGAHRLPFEPAFAHARRELATGALGELKLARSSVYASRVFSTREARAVAASAAGGVLTGVAFDLLLVLDGLFGPPVTVRATMNRLYGGLEDEAHAMLTLANGAEVGLDASWSVPGYPMPAVVLEAEGANGVLLVSDDAYEVHLQRSHAGLPAGHRRLRDGELEQRARFDLDGEARDHLLGAFLRWVRAGQAPLAAGSTLRAQRTLEALYASSRRGGTEVRVGAP